MPTSIINLGSIMLLALFWKSVLLMLLKVKQLNLKSKI
jgi:hypothetical protein